MSLPGATNGWCSPSHPLKEECGYPEVTPLAGLVELSARNPFIARSFLRPYPAAVSLLVALGQLLRVHDGLHVPDFLVRL